jgi:hypothetical protein
MPIIRQCISLNGVHTEQTIGTFGSAIDPEVLKDSLTNKRRG